MIRKLKYIINESGYRSIFRRGFSKIGRESHQLMLFSLHAYQGTYTASEDYTCLYSMMASKCLLANHISESIPPEVIAHYLCHRFDLLGSGWVQVAYGMYCRGLEGYQYHMGGRVEIDSHGDWLVGRINPSNLSKAQHIWRQVDADYQPIDWQLDFKSGHRWSEKTWAKRIKFGKKLGVDVKVPWELSRMQHLPQLALACLSNQTSQSDKQRIQTEFKNQVLDFIATNPPAYGVNWVCPMDIAIRASNWVLAWDILQTSDVQLDANFEGVLATSLYEHGLYVFKNLESMLPKANHYLANIAGLAFISAYLPSTDETDAWLAFAVQELIVEVDLQFYADGGNIEGSTAYHRLSAEMVYFATALILGLPKNRQEKLTTFPDQYFERLERMVEFVMAVTKPNGAIIQIGDNDSGRFLKLAPAYQVMNIKQARETYSHLNGYQDLADSAHYFVENHLDCSHLVDAASGIFERADFDCDKSKTCWDAIVMRALLHERLLPSRGERPVKSETINTDANFHKLVLEVQQLPSSQVIKNSFASSLADLFAELRITTYPDFGLYIFTSANLYLAIRCWTGSKIEHTSHRHQDQLSVELSIDGCDLIVDPGTYVYTPLPSKRHLYRCNNAHFSPFTNRQITGNDSSVFGLLSLEHVQIKYVGLQGFAAESTSTKEKHQLLVLFKNNAVEVYRTDGLMSSQRELIAPLPLFSPGYGMTLV